MTLSPKPGLSGTEMMMCHSYVTACKNFLLGCVCEIILIGFPEDKELEHCFNCFCVKVKFYLYPVVRNSLKTGFIFTELVRHGMAS